jgi:hypothetical protein
MKVTPRRIRRDRRRIPREVSAAHVEFKRLLREGYTSLERDAHLLDVC